jgi:hypothetical protein
LEVLRKELDAIKTDLPIKIYAFTFDEEGINLDDFIDFKNVSIEPIPKKLLEMLETTHA